MKKRITLFLVLFISFAVTDVNAQYVTIPDPNFLSFLQSNYSTAISGNQLDTTNVNVVNDTSFFSSLPSTITDLTGIQYFDQLKHLDCSYNQINYIPALPNRLRDLKCDHNQLGSLPPLPDSLKWLYCPDNILTSLPALPNGILTLYCEINQLSSLPVLPGTLTTLYCGGNQLTSLPSLPASLTWLECNNNQLSSLPLLPPNLSHLVCHSNQLTSLPFLPNSLQVLYCSYNPLNTLPAILPISLISLVCEYDNLMSLPALPNTMTAGLHCAGNQLTMLPSLPNGLQQLICSNNQLVSLPPLPDSIKSLDCTYNNLSCLPYFTTDTFDFFLAKDGNNLTCIPKTYFTNAWDSTMFLPVCSITSGCPLTRQVMGNVHSDTSNNCLADSLNNGQFVKNIKLQSWKNGILNAQKYSDANNLYSFGGVIGDNIVIKIDTTNMPYQVSCPTSSLRNVTLTAIDSIVGHQDFGIKCKPGVDLGVQSISGTFRNAIPRLTTIHAGDLSNQYNLHCASGTSGTVTTSLNGLVSFYSPAPGALAPSSILGNTLTYVIPDFGSVDFNQAFNILIKADTTAPAGSPVCIKTYIATSNDVNHSNDTLEYCGSVVSSFDPNDKSCYPSDITAPDSWLTYTIRFQNTGTDTAYHVYIEDTLDIHLNAQTFTFLASSHTAQVSLEGRNVLFNFFPINLVDSTHNEPLSHGWVQYKIKTNASLPFNTTISNTAFIYFDLNAPVETNTTQNQYGPSNVPNQVGSIKEFTMYPNPANGSLYIKSTRTGNIKIYDITGALQIEKYITDIPAVKMLNISNLVKGIYVVTFTSADGSKRSEKLVVE